MLQFTFDSNGDIYKDKLKIFYSRLLNYFLNFHRKYLSIKKSTILSYCCNKILWDKNTKSNCCTTIELKLQR